MILNFFNFCT